MRIRLVKNREGEKGQAIVLVAITMVVLLLMAAVAIDAGRFVSDRRFLVNATDAAALAGALEWKQALLRGETTVQAEADAKARALQVLHQHYATDPTATIPPDPADPPVYDATCGSTPKCLIDGILVNPVDEPGTVRVAVRNDVDFTFGRVASLIGGNLDFQTISARSRAGKNPNAVGPLPVVAREWIAPFGPRPTIPSPCTYDSRHEEFTATFATAATSCIGSTANSSGRADASVTVPGIPVEILGQGADPCSSPECGNNPASFLGFPALDIRDFSTASSQKFYNGVTAGTAPNVLKQKESSYFCTGYPGPAFKPITSPPDPEDQVAALDGASAGIAIGELSKCYTVGDLIFVLVYDGIVKEVPEFDMRWPGNNSLGELNVSTTGSGTASFNVIKNPALSGNVCLNTSPGAVCPTGLEVLATLPASIGYSPNVVTPTGGNGTPVAVTVTTTAATAGIYAAIIKGTATSYSSVNHYLALSINVAGVRRDFKIDGPKPQGCTVATNSGDTLNCSFDVSNVSNGNRFGAPVTLTLERLDGTVVQSMGSVTPSGSASMSLSTSGLSQGTYTYVVRGTGTNSDGQGVTHLFPFAITVAPQSAPGSDRYVDVTGYAVMRICNPFSSSQLPVTPGKNCLDASRGGMAPNSVWAQAVTPVLTDPNDPALQIVEPVRLIPWEY